jgi:hypothetical protein
MPASVVPTGRPWIPLDLGSSESCSELGPVSARQDELFRRRGCTTASLPVTASLPDVVHVCTVLCASLQLNSEINAWITTLGFTWLVGPSKLKKVSRVLERDGLH